MSVILLLIFFSMLVAGGFLGAFLWAVRSGQFDDQYTPSVRILFENRLAGAKKNKFKRGLEAPGLKTEIHSAQSFHEKKGR